MAASILTAKVTNFIPTYVTNKQTNKNYASESFMRS